MPFVQDPRLNEKRAGERALAHQPALITLDGHRDSSLYRGTDPKPKIILVQILRGARGAAPLVRREAAD